MSNLLPFFLFFLLVQSPPLRVEGRTYKSLILIPSSEDQLVYKVHRKSWRRYMHRFKEHFDAYFIHADPHLEKEFLLKGDVLYVKEEESICPGVMDKTIRAMEAFLPILDQYDYVVRPNLSSFLVLPRLQNFLKNQPLEQFYAGHTYDRSHDRNLPLPWVAGACYILSTDLVRLVLKNKKFLMHRPKLELNWDDLLLAQFMQQHHVLPKHHPSFKLERFYFPHKICSQIPEDIYHFRIRMIHRDRMRYRLEKIIHEELYDMFYVD